MSRIHFSAFIKDLESINPRFKAHTSSLSGLIGYLDRTAQRPSAFHTDKAQAVNQALQFCQNPRDPRLNKYKPAIERLLDVWGHGHKPYPLGARIQKVDIQRICFRGDDRPPSTIFASGFTRRPANRNDQPTYREYKTVSHQIEDYVQHPMHGMSKVGDLVPSSAVCVTPSLNVAALFPLPDKADAARTPIYVYMVYLEKGYNTNLRQALDFLTGISEIQAIQDTGRAQKRTYNKETLRNEVTEIDYDINKAREARVKMVGQALYGLEMAADAIDARHVFAALEVTRTWKTIKNGKVDYKDGGTFQVSKVTRNPRASYPDGFAGVVGEFLDKAGTTAGAMAVTEGGFQPSLKV